MAIIEVFPGNTLSLSQGMGNRPEGASARSQLEISDSVRVSPLFLSVSNTLYIGSAVNPNHSIIHLHVQSFLNLQQQARKVVPISVYQSLAIWHNMRDVKQEEIAHALNLRQVILAYAAKGAVNELNISQDALALFVRHRTLISTLSLANYADAYIEDRCFLGVTPEVIVPSRTISLTYGATTITLKAPDFGNSDKLDVSKVQVNTRGGDLILFRDPSWPIIETLAFQFSYLKPSEVSALMYFVKISLGKDITLVDYEGRTWTGVITTPAVAIIQQDRSNLSAQFEFMGSPS